MTPPPRLGIEVSWYEGNDVDLGSPTIEIFPPDTDPALQTLVIDSIKLEITKGAVHGAVAVAATDGKPVDGATVTVRWQTPLRVVLSTTSDTDQSGVASFMIESGLKGTYTLVVSGIELDGAQWDPSRGPSSASIKLK